MRKTIRRRRLERKTDYKARFSLLKSEKPRLTVRKTNRYIIVQIIKSEMAQDKVLIGITSKDLVPKGWPKELSGSLKSRPASYLAGFLIGKLSKEKNLILDIGMNRNIKKSRIYALLKGAIDAGLSVSHNEEALPSLEEIKSNEKLSQHFEKTLGEIKK